jgi:hypothetical protein
MTGQLRRPAIRPAFEVLLNFLGVAFGLWPLMALLAYFSGSVSLTVAVTVPIVTGLWLLAIGLPPWRLARGASLCLVAFFVGCSLLAAFAVPPAQAWLAGLIGALAGLGLCLLLLWSVATRQFHHLQELVECGKALHAPDASAPRLWHVTDLHITASEDMARYEGGAGGGARWESFVSRSGFGSAAAVIVSGDMTDRGLESEWDRFRAAWRGLAQPRPALVLCPGNHDVGGEHYGGGTWSRYVRPAGLLTYFDTMGEFAPHFETALGGTVGELAAHIERDVTPQLAEKVTFLRRQFEAWESLKELPPARFRLSQPAPDVEPVDTYDWEALAAELLILEWFSTNWYAPFPLRWHAPDMETEFLLLNSCDRADTFGGSGIGSFGQEQLDRLQSALETLPATARHVVIVAHHAVFRRPGQWALPLDRHAIRQLQAFAFLGHRPDETRRFTRLLTDAAERHPDTSFVFCCGHRHAPACGRAGLLLVLEGGSLAEDGVNAWGIVDCVTPPRWRFRGEAISTTPREVDGTARRTYHSFHETDR